MLARDTENDGSLTVPELYAMRLNVRLAVLSRCHVGPQGPSEAGLAGLTEAFLRAGAGAVTVGLWPVADDVAATLMEQVYRDLRAGSDAEALRAAQRALVQASRHPYYWAGFQWLGRAGASAPLPGEG